MVDGAANELYQYSNADPPIFMPDLITGDFDSAKPNVLQFYKEKVGGIGVVRNDGMNTR